MNYYKQVESGYISSVGTGKGFIQIAEKEYKSILDAIRTCPTATDGFGYRLSEDLTWELYELPVVEEEELTTEEAYNIIMGVSE